jgi:hypothetical protein
MSTETPGRSFFTPRPGGTLMTKSGGRQEMTTRFNRVFTNGPSLPRTL